MANFRRGAEASRAAATRKSGAGKFKPTHRFEAGETTYLQFLTPADEIPTVLMHRFICVGFKENGDKKYADFISRRDPDLEGPDGYDELIDRFGSYPTERNIAVAVELEPVFERKNGKKVLDGFDLSEREYTDKEGNEKTVPNVALVIESPKTLFEQLFGWVELTGKNIEDVILAVKRNGKGTDTSYTVVEAGEALDLEDELEEALEELDLEAYLEDLADEDRMRDLLADLADDFVVNQYAKKGKGNKSEAKAKEKPARSTRTRRARDEEPEDDGDDAEEETEEQEEAPTPARRRRNFDALKKDLKG